MRRPIVLYRSGIDDRNTTNDAFYRTEFGLHSIYKTLISLTLFLLSSIIDVLCDIFVKKQKKHHPN